MSDILRSDLPASGALVALDPSTPGVRFGLGCSSNQQIAVCSFGGERPAINLVAYDGSGRRLWDDGGVLGPTAWLSAPLIGRDKTVVVADRDWIMRLDLASGVPLWKMAKPDTGVPISPVPIGSDASMVLLATNRVDAADRSELSTWDRASGALLAHGPLLDPVSGRRYLTRNTPATTGNRVYILAEAEDDETDGRLVALDVCESAACGGRGTLLQRWQHSFPGPSGASPLLIGARLFFDGRDGGRSGLFIAVDDRGDLPRQVWQRKFDGTFMASAARDPRGGLWVQPLNGPAMLRLNEGTGNVLQAVDHTALLQAPVPYTRASVMTVGTRAGSGVYLMLGLRPRDGANGPVYVVAADVGSVAAGRALWSFPLAASPDDNWAPGQFPVVLGPNGQRRVVIPGGRSGTFLVGEP